MAFLATESTNCLQVSKYICKLHPEYFISLCLCSISMYHDLVGEFWYHLQMSADPPASTVLPVMECELGRWTRQDIVLRVPTDQVIKFEPIVSNTNNFTVEHSASSPLQIKNGSPLTVPLNFVPSMLGTSDQTATVVFRSRQVCASHIYLFRYIHAEDLVVSKSRRESPIMILSCTKVLQHLVLCMRFTWCKATCR